MTHKACEGNIKFDSNVIGFVRSVNFNKSGSEETVFYLGNCAGVTTVGAVVTEGTIEIDFDNADTGQAALPDVNGTGALEIWEQTEASGQIRWTGTVTITSVGVTLEGESNSQRTYGFSGALTASAAP